ncbi:hypothetical protein [Pedobacter sp. P26]|uniref:hypothetical protein n=1 Tax=Pedobacter sp. P26 TaxID=3423956 RepID=UPI003D6748BD
MHEYTHVKNGHLAWLQSKREEESMMEAFESNNLSSGNITMQALEMDADSIAINLLLMEVEVFFKYPEYIPLAYIPFFDNMETIGLMLFSVECFFSIFGSIEWSFTDLANYKHPPAPIRRSMMKATVYAYFEQYFPHSIESLLNQSNNVLYEVEMGFSKISGQNVNASSLKLSADTESIDHVHNIMEAWKKSGKSCCHTQRHL